MKTLLLLLLLLLGRAARAQQDRAPYAFSPLPLDSVTRRVAYAGAVAVDGASKYELLARAQHWLLQRLSAYQVSAHQSCPESGALRLRGQFKNGQESFGFQLAVSVGDGRYAYRLDKVTYTYLSQARQGKYSLPGPVTTAIETVVYARPGKSRNKQLNGLDARVKGLLQELNNAVQYPPVCPTTQW